MGPRRGGSVAQEARVIKVHKDGKTVDVRFTADGVVETRVPADYYIEKPHTPSGGARRSPRSAMHKKKLAAKARPAHGKKRGREASAGGGGAASSSDFQPEE